MNAMVGLLLAAQIGLALACSDRSGPESIITDPVLALVPSSDTAALRQDLEAVGATSSVFGVLYDHGVLDPPVVPTPPPPSQQRRCVGFVGVSTVGQIAVGWWERQHPGSDLKRDPPNNQPFDCSLNGDVVPGTWLRNDSGDGPGTASPPTIAAIPGNSTGGIGGCTVGIWAKPNDRCWGAVDSAAVLVGGYTDIIIAPLFGDDEHNSTLSTANQMALDFIVDSLSARHPKARLWASQLTIEGFCRRLGSGGNAQTARAVTYLHQAHLLDLGPTFVLPEALKENGCHAAAAGRQVFADTLAAWLAR